MAFRPCAATGHPYGGPAQYIYPAAIEGGTKWGAKLPLCGPHFRVLLEEIKEKMEFAQTDFITDRADGPLACIECGVADMHSELAVFATVYARGEERQDFYGVAHRSCLDGLKARLLIDSQFAA